MKKWEICKECGTMFQPKVGIQCYCSRECAKIVQYRANKTWRNNNLEKNRDYCRKYSKEHPKKQQLSFAKFEIFTEIKRYTWHRLKIFSHFYNKEKGIATRWKFTDSWKQRLEQMDSFFIDELIKNCINTKIKLETIEQMFKKAIEEQNKYLEEKTKEGDLIEKNKVQ